MSFLERRTSCKTSEGTFTLTTEVSPMVYHELYLEISLL